MNSDDAPEALPRPDRGNDRLSERISRLGEWILAAAFFAAPMTSLRLGGSVTVGDLLLALSALLAAILLLLRPRLPFSSRWIWGGAGILALTVVLAQVFPPVSVEALAESFRRDTYGSSLSGGARLLIALVVLPAAVSIVVSRWSAIPLLMNAFIAGVAVSCGAAIVDAYAGTSIQTSLAANPEQVAGALSLQPPRYSGITGHPNILALTVVLALPFVVGRMTSVRRLLRGFPLGVLFLVAILLTGSRGGLLGYAFVLVLSLALNPRVRSVALSLDLRVLGSYAAGLAVTALLVFAVPIQSVPRPYEAPEPETGKAQAGAGKRGQDKDRGGQGGVNSSRGDDGARPSGAASGQETGGAGQGNKQSRRDRGEDEKSDRVGGEIAGINRIDPGGFSAQFSDAIRRQYIDDSLEYIRDRPFVGYGFEWIEVSHNIYLQLLLSGGLFALIGYLLVMAGYLREAIRLRSRLSGLRLDLLTAASVSIITYLVLGLVLPDIVDRYLYLPVALVLSMSALARSSPDPESPTSDS